MQMLYSKSTKITCLSLILLALLCSKNPLWAMDSDPEINQSEEEISQGDNTPMDSEPQKIPNTSSNCDWSQFCFEEDSDCMDSEQSHDSVNISWDNDDCSQDDSILKQEAISSNSPHDTRGFHEGSYIRTANSISTSTASIEAGPYKTIVQTLCNTIESLVMTIDGNNNLDILREFIRFFEQKIYSDTCKQLFLNENAFNELKESLNEVRKGNVSSYLMLCKKILEDRNIHGATKAVLDSHLKKLHETLKKIIVHAVNSGDHLHLYNKKCFIVISFLRKLEKVITIEQHLQINNDEKLKAFIALDHINLPEFGFRQQNIKGGHIYQKDGYYELWNSQDEEKPRIYGFCVAAENKQNNRLGYWCCCSPSNVCTPMEEDDKQQETNNISDSDDETSGFKFMKENTSSTTSGTTTDSLKTHYIRPFFKISTLFAPDEFDLIWDKIKNLSLTSEVKENILDGFAKKNKEMTPAESYVYTTKISDDSSSYFNMPIRENSDSSMNIPTLYPLFVLDLNKYKLVYNSTEKTLSFVMLLNDITLFEAYSIEKNGATNEFGSYKNPDNPFKLNYLILPMVVSFDLDERNQGIQPKITNEAFSTAHMCNILRNLVNGYYFVVQNLDENKTECDYCLVEVAKYTYVKVYIQ